MTTTEWFRSLPRSKRKELLTWLHDGRRELKKGDASILRVLTELIMRLEEDHHDLRD